MANQPKKYKKFVATAATATLVASAIVPVASAASFTDVSETSEFYPYIETATDELKLFKDTEKFNPNNNITRGQVVLILGRYLEGKGYAPAADYKTNPAFADLKTTSAEENLKYASIVKEAEVFTGSNGNIIWNNNITRQQMAKVLNGLAAVTTGLSLVDIAEEIEDEKVADLGSAQTEYRAAIQALRDLEITTVDNFRPTENLTRAQFAKFIVLTDVAIEAIVETPDFEALVKAVTDAVAALPKVEAITKETATADQAKVDAVNKAIAAAEKALADYGDLLSAEDKAKAEAGIAAAKAAVAPVVAKIAEVTKPVVDLAVESVSAINAKEVQVKFNQKVKKATLTSTDLTIAKAGATGTLALDTSKGTAGFELSADGTTVTLHLAAALTNATGYDVKVDTGVLNEKGEGLKEATVKTFQFNDTDKPTVTSIQSVNGNVVVNFSEKLAAVATTVVINGQSHTVTPTAGDTKVVVPKANFTGAAALEAGKSYPVVVAGAQDYVTNAMDLFQGSVVYSVLTDTVAPTVASTRVLGEKTFEVTFSEEITLAGATPVVSDLGLSVVNASGTIVVANVTTKDKKTFIVTLTSTPFTGLSTSGTATVTFAGFKDTALNVGTTKAETLTFNKDSQAPKFVNSEYNANTNKITLNFDEVLGTDASTTVLAAANVQIIDNKTGQVVATAGPSEVIEANSKSVVFDNTTLALAPGSYTLNVLSGAVNDTASTPNPSAAFTTQVTISGSVAVKPVISSVSASATNVITVTYDITKVPVKGGNVVGSATLAENYKLNGKALPTGSVLTINSTNNVVTITLPTGSIEASGSQILTVSGVQAIASTATIDTVNQIVALVDTKAPEIKSAAVNANGDLVLTFTENVQGTGAGAGVGVQPIVGDFIIAVDGTQITSGLTLANGTSNDQVIIKSANVSLATGTITVKATGTTTGKDAAGNSISTVNTVTVTR